MKKRRKDARHRVGLILALSGLMSAATLVLGPATPVAAQAVGPSWSYTGNLNGVRAGHTATLLQNGNVLVAGGFDNSGNSLNSGELYDSVTGTWSSTGKLNAARGNHTATLLPNGKVLVAGGHSVTAVVPLNSTELYDPATGTWSGTGNLNAARGEHTATLLPNGKVLVVGGLFDSEPDRRSISLDSAELYDQGYGYVE